MQVLLKLMSTIVTIEQLLIAEASNSILLHLISAFDHWELFVSMVVKGR